MSRFVRVLPITIAATCLLLAVRVGDIWLGFSQAQAQATAEPDFAAIANFGAEAQVLPSAGDADATDEHGPGDEHGEESTARPPVGAAAGPDAAGQFTPEEIEVLQELASRRRELVERERQLALREGLLNAAEQRIEGRIREMDELRTRIENLVRRYNDQEETELQSVVKIYETMKPKDAARILGELDLEVLLPILERMKERSMAPVLAAMNAAKAREITAELARQDRIPTPAGG